MVYAQGNHRYIHFVKASHSKIARVPAQISASEFKCHRISSVKACYLLMACAPSVFPPHFRILISGVPFALTRP